MGGTTWGQQMVSTCNTCDDSLGFGIPGGPLPSFERQNEDEVACSDA